MQTGVLDGQVTSGLRADVHHVHKPLDAKEAPPERRLVSVQPGCPIHRHQLGGRQCIDGVKGRQQLIRAVQRLKDLHVFRSLSMHYPRA